MMDRLGLGLSILAAGLAAVAAWLAGGTSVDGGIDRSRGGSPPTRSADGALSPDGRRRVAIEGRLLVATGRLDAALEAIESVRADLERYRLDARERERQVAELSLDLATVPVDSLPSADELRAGGHETAAFERAFTLQVASIDADGAIGLSPEEKERIVEILARERLAAERIGLAAKAGFLSPDEAAARSAAMRRARNDEVEAAVSRGAWESLRDRAPFAERLAPDGGKK